MAERVNLHEEKETLLIALYLRAEDSKAEEPILGDTYAAEVLSRIDYDFDRLESMRGDIPMIASRARQLDRWVEEFLAEYPDGLVLHLACGLDSRPLRVSRPSTSAWIDVDYPEVIELRRRLYDLPESVTTVGASVTERGWWEKVPRDRPTLVLGEGLMMYLPGPEVHRLIERSLAYLPKGQLAFDGVASWVSAAVQLTPAMHRTGTSFHWSLTAPKDLTRQHPGLELIDDVSVAKLALPTYHNPLVRFAIGALELLPPIRDAMRAVRYRFGE